MAVIPARSGSKGLLNKNIRLLCDKPLIYYSIRAALSARSLDRVVVSTDSNDIAEIAKAYGAEVPFLRPAELARDDTPRLPVIRHAVAYLEKAERYKPDIIVTLQPTSPLRRAEHIEVAVDMLVRTHADAVMSVCEAEHSPYWMRRVADDGRLIPILPESEQYTRRQDLPLVYQINGAVYAETYVAVVDEVPQRGSRIQALVMERKDSIDIDGELDFTMAELQLRARMETSSS